MSWQCAECDRAGRDVTNYATDPNCAYCDAPRNSVKRDTEPDDRWRFADAMLTRDAFFWVCILIAIGLAYVAGYASGEAR